MKKALSQKKETKNRIQPVLANEKRETKNKKMPLSPIIIENLKPSVDSGRFNLKTIVGKPVTIKADIFKDGHDILKAALLYKPVNTDSWESTPLLFLENDSWSATFTPNENTRYEIKVTAWVDPLETWITNIEKKCLATQNVPNDISEGIRLFEKLNQLLPAAQAKSLKLFIQQLKVSNGVYDEVLRLIQEPKLIQWVEKYSLKQLETTSDPVLYITVDREKAQFSSWYEFFPRSQGKTKKHGTFKDCINRLDDIKKMGFDVIYLPPIHPVGTTHRKGPNNSLKAKAADPGCPWAIGNKEGGHKSIHPELGTLKDFQNFVCEANKRGIEIALDYALQCSPDHPYVKEHPEWFYRYPDGHIHYSENPPKKYEDIYPLNFNCDNQEELWKELKSIVEYWIEQGVKIFRVDNPHTKPFNFWKWLIAEIQTINPDVLFLSEAFTRPKAMKYLAKVGFTQSYTYFTWRNTKQELKEYLEELTQSEMKHYFRGNLFTNTPDILHEYLQKGGAPAFKIRAALAATLSSSYGIYSGYEFCENTPKEPNSEEYLDSEKYQIKPRNWNAKGNIKDYLTRLNTIRRQNRALQDYTNLTFFETHNDQIIAYGKQSADKSNIIVVVVNLDPFHPQEDSVQLPLSEFGVEPWQSYQMKDLITGEKYYWKGFENYVRLDPFYEPVHIFQLKK